MPDYKIIHKTSYNYSDSVSNCQNRACLLPRESKNQTIAASTLLVNPTPIQYRTYKDYFGNNTSYFAIESAHDTLTVTMESQIYVERPTVDPNEDAMMPIDNVRHALQALPTDNEPWIDEYLLESPMVYWNEEIIKFAQSHLQPQIPIHTAIENIMETFDNEFQFDPNFSNISTPIESVLEKRRGVCQDFAHLVTACLRSQGLAARYVSGYIETLPPEGQKKLEGSDASHAWVSVLIPRLGWCDFDPTNNCWAGSQHITSAWGRDYSDVTPLKGIILGGGAEQQLTVSVDVLRTSDEQLKAVAV